MKRGQPKCVCAPNCKATAGINKNRKVGVNGEFTTFQLPDTNINRHYTVVRAPIPAEVMQNDEPTIININRHEKSFQKNLNQTLEASRQGTTDNSNGDGSLSSAARKIEWKFRSGYFNENSIHLTNNFKELYLGNIVSEFIIIFKNIYCKIFFIRSRNLHTTVPFAAPTGRHIKMNVSYRSEHVDKKIKSLKFSIKDFVRVSS